MPSQIGPNWHGSLRCKVDTSASGNVMPLCAFAKLFPKYIITDGKPLGLHLSHSCNSLQWIYHSSNWCPWHCHLMVTWWSSKTMMVCIFICSPATLGLPSFSMLGIVQMNCAVQLAHRHRTPNAVRKPTIEQYKAQHGLMLTKVNRAKAQTVTVASTQLRRRPHQGLPWLFQMHWPVPLHLLHHLKRWCQTYHSCTKEVSYSHVVPGMWQARWVH